MTAILVQALFMLIVAGVIFYFVRRIVGLIPMEPIIAQAVDIIILLIVVLIVLFYVVLPIVQTLLHVHISLG